MRKSTIYKIRQKIAVILIVLLCIENSIAAVVSSDDGAAFVTKAEFEAMKSDFDLQIERYNDSIDNKIDGAIASYLAGTRVDEPTVLTPSIRDLKDVKWRDKLIKIGRARKWTSGETYTDTANYEWEATYDTVLKSGAGSIPLTATGSDICELIWVCNGTFGHGGQILSLKGEFNGRGYWKRAHWGRQSAFEYDCPNYPMIRYMKHMWATTSEAKQEMLGWWDYGYNFSNVDTFECDSSTGEDGIYLRGDTSGAKAITLFNYKFLGDQGPGRPTNAFGLKMGSSLSAVQTHSSGTGWRPIKASTVFFPSGPSNGGGHNGDMASTGYCKGYATLPLNKYYPIIEYNKNPNKEKITDDNLHTLMLGTTNNQEVNYFICRDDYAFWQDRPDWPEDCYEDFVLTNIQARKVGINQQPSEAETSGGPWGNGTDGNRQEDQYPSQKDLYDGAMGFEGVPTSLNISLPTKPHKKLKLLDSNFISSDEKRYIPFGEGLCITDDCPDNAEITMEFKVKTNSEFNSRNCKATIECLDQSFIATVSSAHYEVDEGATRLSPTSDKWLLDTTNKNTIKVLVRKGKKLYVRFSPNDNNGKNYVQITDFKATWIHS